MHRFLLGLVLLAAGCAGTSGAPDTAGGAEVPPPAGDGPAPTAVGPLDLTVPAAVELAVVRNPDVAMAAARILAARAAVDEARSAWYPKLGLSLGYTHTNDPVLVFMSRLRQRQLEFGGDFNEPGDHGNLRASAELSWLVWDGGRREAGEDLARIGVRREEAGRDAVLNELKAAVIQTCIAVFESEEYTGVAEESLRLVRQQLSIARTRLDAGAAQRSDVLSVEVRQAEAEEGLVRARNAKERALTALRRLLGLRAEEEFSLVSMGGFRVPPVEETRLMETARANRPEVRHALEAVAAAEGAVVLERADRMPTISAFGSYDLDDEDVTFTLKQDSATAGVRVDLNVFEGYRSEARIAAAGARVREAREAVRKTLLAVEADVTRARLDLAEARERVRVSETSVRQAEEALNLIRSRYETGAATITEYLDAEVALTDARVRRVAARFGVERATADLRRALGICRAGMDGNTGGER
jgi:outer membrane protein TolC